MPVDSEDSGSVLATLTRAVLLGLVACACASPVVDTNADVETTQQESQGSRVNQVGDRAFPPDPERPNPSIEKETAQASPTIAVQGWKTEAPSSRPFGLPNWLHGSLALRYRGRWNGEGNDHDLGGVLALDVADRDSSRVSGHLQMRVDADLDGTDTSDGFGSLQDTYDGSVVAKLYMAYADVAVGSNPSDRLGTLRIGRQSDPNLPEVVRLDGVSYTTSPLGKNEVLLGVYGGIPVHLYESSSEGDQAFGTFLEGIPWLGGRARLDWMHLEDENVLGEGEDDLVTLGLWQEVVEHARLEGEYSNLEGDPRDLRLRAMYDDPESQTNLRLGYYELLRPQNALVTELDPFFEQLLTHEPYHQTNFNISHVFGERTTVDAGIDVRRVEDSDDEGEFNRNWERYYTTATFSDIPGKNLTLAVTGDFWNDDSRDITTVGADVSYDPEQRWKASVGTYYSLYKYVFLELDERDDVRTYYFRTTYDITANSVLEFLYELEDASLDTFHTLRLGARWRF